MSDDDADGFGQTFSGTGKAGQGLALAESQLRCAVQSIGEIHKHLRIYHMFVCYVSSLSKCRTTFARQSKRGVRRNTVARIEGRNKT